MRNFKFIASWKLGGVLSFSWTDEQTGNTRKVPVKSTREADKTFGSRDGVTTPTFVAATPECVCGCSHKIFLSDGSA
jgi:hypothetical protein